MSSIGEQSQRIHLPTIKRLKGDKAGVQRDADGEGTVELGRCAMVFRAHGLVLNPVLIREHELVFANQRPHLVEIFRDVLLRR